MVARYAPPISYNFLNLIHLDKGAKTIFEERMGNIDDVVPFFGKGFNKIYPLIMVVYTIVIASDFFDWLVKYFGNWKIFKVHNEDADDLDGFDPSGLIILQRERAWLEQGHKIGEMVVPLARNFNNTSIDVESANNYMVPSEAKASTCVVEDGNSSFSKPLKHEPQHDVHRESINRKYAAMRSQRNKQLTESSFNEKRTYSTLSLHDMEFDSTAPRVEPSSRIASTWQTMKKGFRNLKSNIDAKKLIPSHQVEESKHFRSSSSESLDDIFQRIRRPTTARGGDDHELDDYTLGIRPVTNR